MENSFLAKFDYSQVNLSSLRNELLNYFVDSGLARCTSRSSHPMGIVHNIKCSVNCGRNIVEDTSSEDKYYLITNKYILALIINNLKGTVDSLLNINADQMPDEEDSSISYTDDDIEDTLDPDIEDIDTSHQI